MSENLLEIKDLHVNVGEKRNTKRIKFEHKKRRNPCNNGTKWSRKINTCKCNTK